MNVKTLLQRFRYDLVLIITVILMTVALTALFTFLQKPVYSVKTSYLITPSSMVLDPSRVLSGLSVLGANTVLADTYSAIATSQTIKQQSADALGLSAAQMSNLSIISQPRAGTMIIEIAVQGPEPVMAMNFANKLGENTANYVNQFSGVYNLVLLDKGTLPSMPVQPNLLRNLIFAVLLGLLLGMSVAFGARYLQSLKKGSSQPASMAPAYAARVDEN